MVSGGCFMGDYHLCWCFCAKKIVDVSWQEDNTVLERFLIFDIIQMFNYYIYIYSTWVSLFEALKIHP